MTGAQASLPATPRLPKAWNDCDSTRQRLTSAEAAMCRRGRLRSSRIRRQCDSPSIQYMRSHS